jgi:carbon storage regulator
VRIGIEAPAEVEVHREEVYLEIQEANRQAASPSTEGVAGVAAVLRGRGRKATGGEDDAGGSEPAGASGSTGGPGGASQTSGRGVSGTAAR